MTSGAGYLENLKLQGVLIDEVAQATELSALVPIVLRTHPGIDRVVLVGDHCQLPPSVCSLEAETRGLSLSVFGRLAAQGLKPYFLDTQFRMHPMIAAFSAEAFYHGKLKTGVSSDQRIPPLGFEWPEADSGIAFVNTDSPETKDGESRSNAGEVQAVADILAEVLSTQELGVLDVGVVTPYSAQVRALRSTLRRELPRRCPNVDLTGGLEGRRGQRALEIASVDAYQGREKELIIFSAVRSNRYGQVGFLADWRRLNVMITRARRGLIIVGNTDTLKGDPTWNRWLTWAEANGLMAQHAIKASSSSVFIPSSAGQPATIDSLASMMGSQAQFGGLLANQRTFQTSNFPATIDSLASSSTSVSRSLGTLQPKASSPASVLQSPLGSLHSRLSAASMQGAPSMASSSTGSNISALLANRASQMGGSIPRPSSAPTAPLGMPHVPKAPPIDLFQRIGMGRGKL
eukprot:TRINITY_DN69037_c0_g1_i1.p1 TRINITY_DN69037_c0_g1~~TRINITY_DN69037_c0_g1_i1.p1  ORF type:complete len:472 (+),score=78.04 TRINITY_DN69037_c0_g1_i1:34-1416(+)